MAYSLIETRNEKEHIKDWWYNLRNQYSQNQEQNVIILGDFNSHIGNDNEGMAGNDPEINTNGEQLRALIENRNLHLVNKMNICKGKWTRNDPKGKKSILDMIIINNNMLDKIQSMLIDEEENYQIVRYKKADGKTTEVKTDHKTIILEIKDQYEQLNVSKKVRWNFTNEQNLHKFNSETSKIELKEKWKKYEDINTKYKRWKTQLKSILYKCFP